MSSLDDALAASHEDELELLRAKLEAAKAEARRLRRRANKHRVIEDAIVEAVTAYFDEAPPKLASFKRAKPPRVRGRHEERPQLILTDWQLGKITEDYDPDVCEERVRLVVEKALAIVEDRRASANIRELDLLLLGDMVEGESIFPGQAFEIDGPVIDQVERAARLMAEAASRLVANFDRIRVYGISGNHGRVSPRGITQSGKTNWDRVSYRMALAYLDRLPAPDRKRIEFEIADRPWHIHDALGWRVLKFHGDVVRGGHAGFPWYGVGRKASGWKDALGEPYDIAVHGHFHTPVMFVQNTSMVFGTGSTESSNEYARSELAAAGDPSQRLLMVSKDHGVVGDHILWCVDRRPFGDRMAGHASAPAAQSCPDRAQ